MAVIAVIPARYGSTRLPGKLLARKTGKYLLTTGSCNWTGRNMDGVNMEANVVVEGSEKVVAAFNAYFDAFWSNKGAVEYSLPYELFKDQTAADWKWTRGEKPFYYSTF